MSELSIVIITLNEEFNLPDTLNDILAQTNQNFEVIIVDSNSEDNTIKIAQSYSDKFQNFQIIEMTKRGASLGRNTGANVASFDRLLFLDSDSRLKPQFIQESMDLLHKTGVDVGAIYLTMNAGTLAHKFTSIIINLGMWFTKFFSPTAVGACLFSTKSAHNLIGGFNPNIPISDDCNYVLKAYKHKDIKFKMLPLYFGFDMRRFEQDGYINTLAKYGIANMRRFFMGEYKKDEIEYKFGEYNKKKDNN